MAKTALVTGASGFIGTNLMKNLEEHNYTVTGLFHNNSITSTSIKKIKVDLTKSDFSLPEENYDIVYHLAAVTPMEKNKTIQKKVNYEGTINLFNEIKDKTKFFVHVSGLGVFGDPGGITIDENTPLKPHTEYAQIRLDAQRFLEKKCKENSISLSVAYLGEIYGNGGWYTSQIIERLKKGKFKLPKSGNYFRSFAHVEDAASALVAIGEKNAINESFIITDSSPVVFKEFINYTCDKLGVKYPGNIPMFLAKAILGGDFTKLLTTPIRASNKKISNLINFKYPTIKEGIDSVFSEI